MDRPRQFADATGARRQSWRGARHRGSPRVRPSGSLWCGL